MVFARVRRARRRASRASPPARDARRPTACTLLAFLLFCPSPARGQFGPFGSEGSGAATCDIDISTIRLDPALGEMCDPAKQGDGLCDACICDMSDRILEAGYAVTGPEAISFETCAFEHLATLQRRGGITLNGMMTVASRCSEIPACVAELEAKHGVAGDAAATDRGVSATDPNALARSRAGGGAGPGPHGVVSAPRASARVPGGRARRRRRGERPRGGQKAGLRGHHLRGDAAAAFPECTRTIRTSTAARKRA